MQGASLPARSFEVIGSRGSAVLAPIEPPQLQFAFAQSAQPAPQAIPAVPGAFQRYVGDFIELATAIRTHTPLSVSLEEELLVQECLLRASEML
jgi:hypothetical protein